MGPRLRFADPCENFSVIFSCISQHKNRSPALDFSLEGAEDDRWPVRRAPLSNGSCLPRIWLYSGFFILTQAADRSSDSWVFPFRHVPLQARFAGRPENLNAGSRQVGGEHDRRGRLRQDILRLFLAPEWRPFAKILSALPQQIEGREFGGPRNSSCLDMLLTSLPRQQNSPSRRGVPASKSPWMFTGIWCLGRIGRP